MRQNRLKSPVLWGAAAGVILLAIEHFGLGDSAQEGAQLADLVFKAVCAILAIFGVVNNPTDKTNL